jgi:hypothetical protein
MDASIRRETYFHLTGQRPAAAFDAIEGLRLRPALLARYRDLTRLRYDFPVVLVEAGSDGTFVRSLSEIVDDMLRQVAPRGIEGEGLRKHVLSVERGIRRLVAGGASGSLSSLWERAVQQGAVGEDTGLARYLEEAGASLGVDGEVLDCDPTLPGRLLAHAWRAAQLLKARQRRAEINRLIVKLSDALRADFVKSEAGSRPESLKASLGDRHQGLFDFEAMSRLLRRATHGAPLSDARRLRIERVLVTLRSQRFFAAPASDPAARAGASPYEFEFQTPAEVLAAFRERLPPMIELIKALAIAELEVDGRYVEATHDPFFANFGEAALGPDDLARFPDYLVCLKAGAAPGGMALMELLSSGVPVKVLVEVDDLFEDASLGAGRFAFGVRNVQVASMALGLTDAFVLQSSSSNLLRMRQAIGRGLSASGPALFSVFSPAASGGGLPGYLVAAAAMQSRAFPAFVYDPSAGPDLADRFSLQDNPDPGSDWTEASFEYADADLQRVTERVAFTFVDFLACDPRHAGHFAMLPYEAWGDDLVPVADWLSRPDAAGPGRVPCLLAVDDEGLLQKLVVDERAIQAARRCRETWHRLQELGGVRSSHANRLLAREKAAWEQKGLAEPGARPVEAAQVAAAEAVAASSPVAADEPEPARSPDEAYIETIRCSSCNECTQVNDRMFAYNANKQAYIADVTAGTFRQLVEAAESCQLGIIHPGKPLNPQEPGLEDLMERARPFA